jgi:hypothetical protein
VPFRKLSQLKWRWDGGFAKSYDGYDRPDYDGDSHDGVGAPFLHRQHPRDLENHVGDIEQRRKIGEFIALETDVFFEAEYASISCFSLVSSQNEVPEGD